MSSYQTLIQTLKEVATLGSVGALLSWDQETMMPPQAGAFRAEELAMISALAHRRFTDPAVGELIAACEADPHVVADPIEQANLREIRRDYDRATKLPAELVAEISETSSRAIEAWKQAREASDYAAFRPWLEKQLELNRRKAECYGIPEGGELYDALIEDYEPSMRAAELERLFAPLRETLAPLIAELRACGPGPDRSPCRVEVPIERQREFNRVVAERVGYDLTAGRLDASTHPFTEGLAPGDTRITTRYAPDQFADAMYSTLHEAGHALYEQGLPKAERHGQPLAGPVSLGIHESQSRMWENQVGRSRPFWDWVMPVVRQTMGPVLDAYDANDLYRAVNTAEPHLIRVESDEATYNLHIMLRFDLERALLGGDLSVADLPGAWNERIKQDLGLDVPDDRRGCLQDIHWSMGAIGYFPTYTLGNLYAAQLWQAIRRDIEDLDSRIARGEFAVLLEWLRENIHRHGRRYPAAKLCQRITGKPLDHRALIDSLEQKLRPIYSPSA